MSSRGVAVEGGRCCREGWLPKEMPSQGGVKIERMKKGGVRIGRWEVKISLRI